MMMKTQAIRAHTTSLIGTYPEHLYSAQNIRQIENIVQIDII